ncbi:hypothetical protein [Sphingomonas nostoxanthinifaciens]|uniref:hypothetical protein n=1 Tax=Sphingomonas nostoxanthinifaciens TaxID=2872652 RepID=UPI001CC1E907|nr:hypothetical protein [Sphingomonas nostoxanthinifaciens]UAK25274.1 hypothetical protein K8P63_03520 [Sphingomonas nostoxanthinifaciens]
MADEDDRRALSFEQKLALHQLWLTKIDAKRRELLSLISATSALLVAIPLVGAHVTAGSPTTVYLAGTMVMVFGLFIAGTVAGSDLGTVIQDYEADTRIDDDRIPRPAMAWRRQIVPLAVGTMAVFGLCFLALAAVSDDLGRARHAIGMTHEEPLGGTAGNS